MNTLDDLELVADMGLSFQYSLRREQLVNDYSPFSDFTDEWLGWSADRYQRAVMVDDLRIITGSRHSGEKTAVFILLVTNSFFNFNNSISELSVQAVEDSIANALVALVAYSTRLDVIRAAKLISDRKSSAGADL